MSIVSGIYWRSISVSYSSASLDFKKTPGAFNTLTPNEISESVEALLLQAGGSVLVSNIVGSLIRQKIAKKFFDYYTSPLLGPKTPRLNFVFPLYLIAPFDFPIPCVREELKAIGKRGSIGGKPVVSKFDVDLVICEVQQADIPELLNSNPDWFHGEIELSKSSYDSLRASTSVSGKPTSHDSKK
ncbi:MAG: M protein [Coriander cytorhabdovirus 1]|nr:MAG: M protein [Coriander cytorhabdovirus 1]